VKRTFEGSGKGWRVPDRFKGRIKTTEDIERRTMMKGNGSKAENTVSLAEEKRN
jgi:hypothetical protein